jgi:hypothetical protein
MDVDMLLKITQTNISEVIQSLYLCTFSAPPKPHAVLSELHPHLSQAHRLDFFINNNNTIQSTLTLVVPVVPHLTTLNIKGFMGSSGKLEDILGFFPQLNKLELDIRRVSNCQNARHSMALQPRLLDISICVYYRCIETLIWLENFVSEHRIISTKCTQICNITCMFSAGGVYPERGACQHHPQRHNQMMNWITTAFPAIQTQQSMCLSPVTTARLRWSPKPKTMFPPAPPSSPLPRPTR